MTADLTPSLDEQKRAEAEDRTKLLAALAREAATPTGRHIVYRQLFVAGQVVERPMSGHRFEWVAQLWAHHRERQHGHEAGGHYTVRRADA